MIYVEMQVLNSVVQKKRGKNETICVSQNCYVLTVVILIVCFCVFFLVREKKIEKENVRETISIEYQDNFEEVKILDYEGKTVENFGVGEKPSVIFYLSNTRPDMHRRFG